MTRRETPLDAAEILRRLAASEVDYLLIGGLAVQAHGHIRTTQDVDLMPATDPANLNRLAATLTDLSAHPVGGRVGVLRGSDLAAAKTLLFDTDAGGVDVHTAPPGAGRYSDLRRRALELEVMGIPTAVVGLDDLISMKRASGRPIDRGDVIALTTPES